MATRKFILSLGQSQGAAVSERSKNEDKMPGTAVRNPAVYPKTSIYSRSFTRDTFTMPGSWPEGYQTLNLKGRATSAIRRFTLFNPTSTFFDMQNVGGAVGASDYTWLYTTTYPGYARAVDIQTSDSRLRVDLSCVFQVDPANKHLTRLSTGERLQIAGSGWSASTPGRITLNSATPLDPPLQTGEVFQLELEAIAGSSVTKVFPNVRFGGYHDVGSQYEVAASVSLSAQSTLGGYNVAAYPITWSPVSTGNPVVFTATNHYYRPGMRLRFEVAGGGAHPDVTATTVDYYVVRVVESGTASTVYLSTTRNGATLNSAAGGGITGTWTASILPQHVKSTMAGMRVRFTSGALSGLAYALKDNTEEAAGAFSLHTEAMSGTPSVGDAFVIEPMPVGAEAPPWDEWGFFLPESRMTGLAPNINPKPIMLSVAGVTSGTAATFTAVAGQLYEGARIRCYDSFNLSTALAVNAVPASGSITGAGQALFVRNYNYATGVFNVSTTYSGAVVSDATLSAATWSAWIDEHPDRGNPMPPGFNYDNVDPIPRDYNPYFGASPAQFPSEYGASYTTSLALRMHQHIGEEVYLVHANIPGTSLARREAFDGTLTDTDAAAHGWYDKAAQLDWSPNSERDNCFAVMKKKLIAAKRTAEAQGDTLECLGVWNLQGESDAASATHAAAYGDNLRAFVREVRELLVNQGMWAQSAESIPWWQPKIPTGVGFVDWASDNYVTVGVVNAAISSVADADPFFRTRVLTDATIGFDQIHYSGDYLFTLGEHAFTDWLALAAGEGTRTRVDISNQALKNLGETKTIVSLTEDTAAARLCNRYYDVALQSMLEAFPWPFATETKKLTANETNDRKDIDWQYAYTLPANFLSVVTIGPDVAGANVIGEADFDIEGSVLYCNQADIVLRYTVKSPDPTKYSQHFTNGLAAKLAAEIAPGLMQGDTGVQMAGQMEQRALYFVGQAQQFSALRERNADNNARSHPFDNRF